MNTTTQKTTRWLTVVALVSLVSLASGLLQTVQAAPRGHEGGMMMSGRGMDRMLDNVDATAEQKAQIRQIGDGLHADMQAQRESRRDMHEQMRALFTEPTVDANRAEVLRQQMLAQHEQASRRTMQAMLEVSRVLTPEQRVKIADKMKARAEHRKMHQRESRPRQGG